MLNWLLIELNGLADLVRNLFAYIFPEYPPAGILTTILAGLLFLYYAFKAGLYEGIKIGGIIWLLLVIVLLSIHRIAMIFSPHAL